VEWQAGSAVGHPGLQSREHRHAGRTHSDSPLPLSWEGSIAVHAGPAAER